MSEQSKIQWTDATWNPTRGCTKIAQGCKECYAEKFAERFRGVKGHPYERGFDPRTAPDKLTEPLRWKRPRRIFVDSMSDLFHEAFDFPYIAAVFGVMGIASWHTFQVLTKRAERAAEFFRWVNRDRILDALCDVSGVRLDHIMATWRGVDPTLWPLPNVHIGTSIANQGDADRNIPHLLQIPAAVRFLSCEPLIGPIEFSDVTRRSDAVSQLGKKALDGIAWVIVGGESGPKSRPCDVEWIRSIVQQCKATGVPVFVKQLGTDIRADLSEDICTWGNGGDSLRYNDENCLDELIIQTTDRKGGDPEEWPADLRIREFPEVRS